MNDYVICKETFMQSHQWTLQGVQVQYNSGGHFTSPALFPRRLKNEQYVVCSFHPVLSRGAKRSIDIHCMTESFIISGLSLSQYL